MNSVTSYGSITLADEEQEKELKKIDNDCAECLYEAAKRATDDILAAVIENELTETERDAVKMYWFNNMKASAIAALCGTSAQNVRRIVKRAEKKIYTSMKYVVMYNFIVSGRDELPKDFHFKIINCVNGKELIS